MVKCCFELTLPIRLGDNILLTYSNNMQESFIRALLKPTALRFVISQLFKTLKLFYVHIL